MKERQTTHRETAVAPEAPTDPRLDAALLTLEQGIESVLTSEGFADYLRTQSRFHKYSFNNTLLIMMQKPDATRVAGYNRWKQLERQVRKGEKAIKIFVPYISKVIDEDSGQLVERVTGFGIGNVFDVSSTDGKPLPVPPSPEHLRGESALSEGLYRATEAYLVEEGIKVRRLPGKENGLYRPAKQEVVVNFLLKGNQAAKTLVHEAAHYTAGHRGFISREDAETVAESSAFVVLNHFGIDSGSYSFGYVAGWAEDKNVLKRNLQAIQKTSRVLIDAIEPRLGKKPDEEVVFSERPLSADELLPNRGRGLPPGSTNRRNPR